MRTLSRADKLLNIRVVWKVRATPREVMTSGLRPASPTGLSVARSRIEPALILTIPVMQLKRVVLPAPLGPIRPKIEPLGTVVLTASTAVRPP